MLNLPQRLNILYIDNNKIALKQSNWHFSNSVKLPLATLESHTDVSVQILAILLLIQLPNNGWEKQKMAQVLERHG